MLKLDGAKFKGRIHESWHPKLLPLIEGRECWDVYQHLKKRSGAGAKIAPDNTDTWRAFRETKLDELKAVLVGYCPYHTIKDGIMVADGLCMSCGYTETLQPSLSMYYDAMENEFGDGLLLDLIREPDLKFLANQGVLLVNSALTTEVNTPGKHNEIWEPFMKLVFKEIIADTGVPVIFMGKQAQLLNGSLGKDQWQFNIEHPAYAARQNRAWNTQGAFRKVKDLVKGMNGFDIEWYETLPF